MLALALGAAALALPPAPRNASDPAEEDALGLRRRLGPPAPAPLGTPAWTGPGASPRPRSNEKLAAAHGGPPAPVPVFPAGSNSECRRIQHSTWKNGWNSVPQADKDAWKASKCPEKLRVRPKQERIGACPRFPKSMKADATKKVKALENSHRGEVCARARAGSSL